MSKELKPCPFCGGNARYYHDSSHWTYVECSKCHTKSDVVTISVHYCAEDRAAELWNTRVDEKPIRDDAEVSVGATQGPLKYFICPDEPVNTYILTLNKVAACCILRCDTCAISISCNGPLESGEVKAPLRKWLPGDKVPDGYYWFVKGNTKEINLVDKQSVLFNYDLPTDLRDFDFDELYGPIPELEVPKNV